MDSSTINTHLDAIIVGSGFGGSVTVYWLAEAGLRVCIRSGERRTRPVSFPVPPPDEE
jgi:cholesterol oxidase